MLFEDSQTLTCSWKGNHLLFVDVPLFFPLLLRADLVMAFEKFNWKKVKINRKWRAAHSSSRYQKKQKDFLKALLQVPTKQLSALHMVVVG